MAQSRFRVERCAAHGIAVGLCTVGTCKGSAEAKKLDRQLVEIIKPPRCSACKQERGDAIKRGEFIGAKGNHPGYQKAFCDTCWEAKVARDKAAAAPRTRLDIQRLERKKTQRLISLARQAEESESASHRYE